MAAARRHGFQEVRVQLVKGARLYSDTPLQRPDDAVWVMREALSALDREEVIVINLNNHLKPVNYNVVSIGSLNTSLAPIQNVLKSTILSNCTNMMLMHNHPSGEIEPSKEDVAVTRKLCEAAKIFDMAVIDHIIVGGETGKLYSFRENYPELFGNTVDMAVIRQIMERR